MIPQSVFLTKGVGIHKERLASFELALRNASIAQFNLVQVSSILPPNCKIVSREKVLSALKPGQIVYCVMAKNETNEPNRLLAASVGLAAPADRGQYGYLSEHHSFGETERSAGDYAEDLAAEMLASTLGIETPEGIEWKEKEEVFKISGKIVRTSNITQSAVAPKIGYWVSVVAAAVFVEENNFTAKGGGAVH